ncbi:protein kinase family protein [Geodermatophilus ruber]|uniref:Putative peptidoglycan lipid II flippase n=1 Tax=Geodermatophilus ruber TaxID=504800 RepID=A0A1I4J5W4_9ACTN|nr:protein kinase family protein [Geodermatophilus ruber]SFL61995.1 putative peptidoglycan lipid II flippase [Geodermatophilus ruber]
MTSTITGLPDRYRPLDEFGPPESTATGVIHCWRAKDRVLNRDVAIRVHTPGGLPARDWITRALTAGGLATPALAMVYDAAEGSAPGGAAYVVNEWIEGQTLAERLAEGPMTEREARTVLRRLAEGVAEAHRVGLAVGGLTPETVVLRPNGLVGLRAVPAASGTMQGDIAALGELLDHCLTGPRAGASGRPPAVAPDLAALIRRARSTEPGAGLSSAAAMAALLAEPSRRGQGLSDSGRVVDLEDSGWLRRLRERRDEVTVDPAPTMDTHGEDTPRRLDPQGRPPVPPPRGQVTEEPLLPLAEDADDDAPLEDGGTVPEGRRRLLVVGLPLLALVVVVALAWWIGSNVLSVAGDVGGEGAPTASAPAAGSSTGAEPTPATPPALTITDATVFDPGGDGGPENDGDVPLSFDGDPATAWSTVSYRGSPNFGNLKDGVGVVYDLGSERAVAGVQLTTTTPGASVEVRTGDRPDGALDSFDLVASGELTGTTELSFDDPVTTRYLLVWLTSLVPADGGFSATVAEVSPQPAG